MLQDRTIEYSLLARVCEYYQRDGYTQREVPWIVDGSVSRSTSPLPGNGFSFVLEDSRHLVASAEHGFVQRLMEGSLDFGRKYFAVSPCFRDEAHDATHCKWFMKLELFACHISEAIAYKTAHDMLASAKTFAISQGCIDLWHQKTDIGYDLMCGDLEIGSYGIRAFDNCYAAYGTGAALPRLSLAIDGSNLHADQTGGWGSL